MDGMCPCCGDETEDHVHLYHCPHEDMRECLEKGLDEMVKTFHKENMPSQISLAYVDCLRRITHSTREKKTYHCPHADRAVGLQDHLGSFAILRGHHHTQWAYSILDTYKPPRAPPGNKPPKTRSPFELSVLLVEATWRLFDSLWETRNNILHKDDSIAAKAEQVHLTEQLLLFRRRRHTLLRYTDRHHIEHPVCEIVGWKRSQKRKMLKLLQKLYSIHMKEIQQATQSQKTLLSYGFLLPSLDVPDISEREPD